MSIDEISKLVKDVVEKEYPSKEGTANYPKKVFKNKTLQKTLSALIILGYTSSWTHTASSGSHSLFIWRLQSILS